MTSRNNALGVLAFLLVSYPACLKAQEPPTAKSDKDLAAAVSQLTQQVGQISTQMQQLQKELVDLKGARPTQALPVRGEETAAATPQGEGPVTRAEFETLQTKVQTHTDLIDSIDDKLVGMAQDAREFVAQAQEQNVLQEKMLAAISTTGAGGNPIPNLRAVMSDARGREALEEAVHQVLRRTGVVTVENQMGQSYTMRINDRTHVIAAGGTTKIEDVPVGNVTSELVGYEQPKTLALAPPTYELKILIRPEQREVVRRVASPVVYDESYGYSYRYDPLLGWVWTP